MTVSCRFIMFSTICNVARQKRQSAAIRATRSLGLFARSFDKGEIRTRRSLCKCISPCLTRSKRILFTGSALRNPDSKSRDKQLKASDEGGKEIQRRGRKRGKESADETAS